MINVLINLPDGTEILRQYPQVPSIGHKIAIDNTCVMTVHDVIWNPEHVRENLSITYKMRTPDVVVLVDYKHNIED